MSLGKPILGMISGEANKLINEMFENQNALNGYNEMLKKIL